MIKPGMYQIDTRTTQTRAPQLPQTSRNTNPRVSTSTGVIHKTNVSRLQLRSTQIKDKVVPNNSQVKDKKTEVEDHHRMSSVSNKAKSVTAYNDSLKSRASNVNAVCATCGKCLFNSDHYACVSKFFNDVNARANKPNVLVLENPKVKRTDLLQHLLRKQLHQTPLSKNLIVTIVAFRKSTCYVRDLQGNDLLTGNRGSDLYTISLQETTSSTPICFMAKASLTQAWLWHRRLSHLNFDYINLLSKKDVVIGLPKLKYVKDQLCSSCEVSKAKRSSLKTKVVPSSKGRLNLLHMDLCGPMRVASINGKKYILHQNSTPRTPEQNGVVERRNHTLVEAARTMLSASNFLCSFGVKQLEPHAILKTDLSSSHTTVPSQQELDLLFGPLYDEFFTAGTSSINNSSSPTDNSKQQDTPPTTNIQSSTEPITPKNVNAEENNDNQAEDAQFQQDEFINAFCTPVREIVESSSRNIDNSNMHTFYQPYDSGYRWTKDHPLEQVRRNPSKPVQTR
ncbi:retrovirus-related pol polyprotein from transposon TNT 1-94 [Tanacetum coccineum]|uniref:Retrovirus-related pol polyprotein from transposon TNT 1-94 n=1 Tax=Tanacetum coccineum TaxID=301880 RepID=A0ABQ5G7T1_9ASTR